MPTYKIRGIDVDFPYEAYECQLLYMDKVIQSLQNKCNALLESPTGTGKTLCLLCATLAWRKSLGPFTNGKLERNGQTVGSKSDSAPSLSQQSGGDNYPTIVYTSRTHSQLRQVIQELKRSNYRPKMIILGSRQQLCIHEDVSLLHGKAQDNACHSLCKKRDKGKKRYCNHFSRVSDYVKQNPHLGDEPIDIEDLVNIGKTSGPCPYYVSRELHKVVDIVFAPYNYLIDRGNRKSLNVQWENSVLIFDEAHNLESLCADAASFDLPSGVLAACVSEAETCRNLSGARRDRSSDKSQNPENFAILRALLLKLEARIAEVTIKSKELGFTQPGPYIYELFTELNITHETATKLIDIIEEASVLLEEEKSKDGVCRLESISNILKLIFKDKKNAHAEHYRVHVQEVETYGVDAFKGKSSRMLSWWCFNPGIAMEEFAKLGVGSIILTSGTLSPMDSFAQELKLDFPVRLENPHVISSNQIWAGVVPAGPSGRSFNSSYKNRDSLEYKRELGNAIVNFARIVPDGLLVFFPSYYMLDKCITCWKDVSDVASASIWERICKYKKPVVEPRQSSIFSLSIEDYMAKLKDTSSSGAVFFAVCRGKVSEGLDFADHAGRAVVITGLPFATLTDPKIRLKREFLDKQLSLQREERKNFLTGEEWYNQLATRAVNQAIGRVIRHRHDYGAIILCDERFGYANRQSQISRWIQPHIKHYARFGEVVYSLTRFFREGATLGPKIPSLLENDSSATGNSTSSSMVSLVEENSTRPFDNPFSGKNLQTTSVNEASGYSLSSLLEVKRGNTSSQLGRVVPANRSSLTPTQAFQSAKVKFLNNPIYNDKKMVISRKKNIQKTCEIVDLTDDSLGERKPVKEELLIPCSAKKRKVLNIEHEQMQHVQSAERLKQQSKSLSVPEYGKLDVLDIRSRKGIQIGSDSMHEPDIFMRKRGLESFVSENKGSQSTVSLSVDQEAKGSTFLVQAKEKLSAVEYKQFVGFMKALKSKAMDAGQILKSIVELFSGPERLPLLQRYYLLISTLECYLHCWGRAFLSA
ncbi:hypothetical protein ACFE04_004010 [Oxalis oulophora]